MKNTLGAVLLFPDTPKQPNDAPGRHSSEALNLQFWATDLMLRSARRSSEWLKPVQGSTSNVD
jgi:hypothetical protein